MNSYPSIYNMGHRYVADLLKYPVYIEEKVDGSQFSFGILNGQLQVCSKGATMYVNAPEKMFNKAVEAVKARKEFLKEGWRYSGEFLAKPKHNVLAYSRVPMDNIIIFDITSGEETYLHYKEKRREAQRLNLETVPLLFEGMVNSLEEFRQFLDTDSILGGTKIEGVVVKPVGYNVFGLDKKVLFGKFVSEIFKESHKAEWKTENPGQSDIPSIIAAGLTTPARWNKAVQHLREQGKIEDFPKDIGKLIGEVQTDIKKECKEEILEQLWKWAWPQIRRKVTAGMPEWYKEELLKRQFENQAEEKG